MAKQTFTTGQVLSAAQMNALQLNDYNQTVSAKTASYVLTASDAGTRITMSNASATTVTVNTGLFSAGDTLQITNIGAGVVTITAGTATVSTAGVLTLAQNATGTLYFTSTGVSIWNGSAAGSSSALTLITTTSFSAASAMSINNCFSSTYTNYLIQFKLGVTSGTVDIYYKERSSSTDDSDFYYYGATKVTNGGTVTGTGAANTTAFTICNTSTDGYGSIIVYSPAVATNTYYDWKTMDYSPNIVSGGGLHASTPTTCDGFSIIPASSTITGTVSVYGYSK